MIAKYGKELRTIDEDVAMTMIKYAKYRLEHYHDMVKLFERHAEKDSNFERGGIMECLWNKTLELMEEEAKEIRLCIEEF